MATPRIPGALRGRPRGSRRDLRVDPDRYAVAAGLALQTLGHSQSKAFDLAATATPYCEEARLPTMTRIDGSRVSRRRFTLGAPLGKNVEPTIKGRSSVLRQKSMRIYAPEEALWLRQMAKAIHLSMIGRKDAYLFILAYAGSVGELQFALDRLVSRLPE